MINIVSVGGPTNSYGLMAEAFCKALHQLDVAVRPVAADVLKWPSWMQRQAGIDLGDLTITMLPAQHVTSIPGRQWVFTMYESTGLPDGFVSNLNKHAERVLVPHEFLVDILRENGCKRPVHVIPLGIDPEHYHPWFKPDHSGLPYTFLTLGDQTQRKGTDVTIQAFLDAFGKAFEPDEKYRDDVRLIIKLRPGSGSPLEYATEPPYDPRILIWSDDLDDMRRFYEMGDCFVMASRGEGWGLPAREAAAMGLPVIATTWGGLLDNIGQWGIPIPCTMVESKQPGGGEWAEPVMSYLSAAMTYCVEKAGEARAKALKAAMWLRQNQTWVHAASALADLVIALTHTPPIPPETTLVELEALQRVINENGKGEQHADIPTG